MLFFLSYFSVRFHGPFVILSSTIILIPKGKRGDLTTSDNFKVFDTILINNYEKQLKYRDLQFAFKATLASDNIYV